MVTGLHGSGVETAQEIVNEMTTEGHGKTGIEVHLDGEMTTKGIGDPDTKTTGGMMIVNGDGERLMMIGNGGMGTRGTMLGVRDQGQDLLEGGMVGIDPGGIQGRVTIGEANE